jgi:hypothetical protein
MGRLQLPLPLLFGCERGRPVRDARFKYHRRLRFRGDYFCPIKVKFAAFKHQIFAVFNRFLIDFRLIFGLFLTQKAPNANAKGASV